MKVYVDEQEFRKAVEKIVTEVMNKANREAVAFFRKETQKHAPRGGEPWTELEEEQLKNRFCEALMSLAQAHGRSYNSITARLRYISEKGWNPFF